MNDDAEPPKNTQENEFKSADKKGRDGELPEALKKNQFKSEDDDPDDDESGEMQSAGRPKAADKRAKDRQAVHDALDAILDRTDGQEIGIPKGRDEDVEELKNLLDEFEEEEPDTAELEKIIAGDDSCPDCGEAHDSEECPGEELDESGEEDLVGDEEGESPDPDSDDDQEDVEDGKGKDAKARDRARAADASMATLRMFRPFAARSKDKAFQQAFNKALDSVKRSSRASSGSYGKFATASRARDKAPRNPNPDRSRAADTGGKDAVTSMQEFYNKAHKGGK